MTPEAIGRALVAPRRRVDWRQVDLAKRVQITLLNITVVRAWKSAHWYRYRNASASPAASVPVKYHLH